MSTRCTTGTWKGLRKLGEAGHLEGCVRGPRRAVVVGIARDDRDRPAIEVGEPGDERAAPRLPDLEERARVHERLDDRAHAVDLAPVARDRPDEPFLAPRRIVARRAARRQLVHRLGEVGEEATGVGERLRLGVDHRVHRPDAGVHVGAPKLLLVDHFPDAGPPPAAPPRIPGRCLARAPSNGSSRAGRSRARR